MKHLLAMILVIVAMIIGAVVSAGAGFVGMVVVVGGVAAHDCAESIRHHR